MMVKTLDERLERIEAYGGELQQYFIKEMHADPTMYVPDLVIYGALKRTLALSDGFRLHIRERNFTCAAALLRFSSTQSARWSILSPLVKNLKRNPAKHISPPKIGRWAGARLPAPAL